MSETIILDPVHPGEILLEDFMEPLGLSQTRLGIELKIPPARVNEIVHGKRGISADTALRLARFFGVSPEFWLGLQMDYDLDVAKDKSLKAIQEEIRPRTNEQIPTE
ncbi:MAG: HigA family addiction module antidote protein [Deltaproteobacteria bacterium]|nr:HigA family addiction module antidote protein [Deltaproteobacteria bacterium]